MEWREQPAHLPACLQTLALASWIGGWKAQVLLHPKQEEERKMLETGGAVPTPQSTTGTERWGRLPALVALALRHCMGLLRPPSSQAPCCCCLPPERGAWFDSTACSVQRPGLDGMDGAREQNHSIINLTRNGRSKGTNVVAPSWTELQHVRDSPGSVYKRLKRTWGWRVGRVQKDRLGAFKLGKKSEPAGHSGAAHPLGKPRQSPKVPS